MARSGLAVAGASYAQVGMGEEGLWRQSTAPERIALAEVKGILWEDSGKEGAPTMPALSPPLSRLPQPLPELCPRGLSLWVPSAQGLEKDWGRRGTEDIALSSQGLNLIEGVKGSCSSPSFSFCAPSLPRTPIPSRPQHQIQTCSQASKLLPVTLLHFSFPPLQPSCPLGFSS